VCFSRGCAAGLGAIWPVIPKCTRSEADAASPFVVTLGAPLTADSRSSINFPWRSTASMRRPGRCCSSATGSSIKSVFPSVTDRIRRPRIVRRNPRATVSTSGSSGIGGANLQNSTAARAMLFARKREAGVAPVRLSRKLRESRQKMNEKCYVVAQHAAPLQRESRPGYFL